MRGLNFSLRPKNLGLLAVTALNFFRNVVRPRFKEVYSGSELASRHATVTRK